jgi:CIC family chloride channel protein
VKLNLPRRISPQGRDLVRTLAVGLAAGLSAVLFHLAIHFTFEHGLVRLTREDPVVFLAGSFVLLVATSALSGWLLSSFCPEAAGSGIPQVKLAFWKDMGFIPWRVVWVKFIGGVLSVGGGASVGREGPSVQLASGVASVTAGVLGRPAHQRRAATAAGAAAGLAAAFNTPLAAVTFVLEEIIGDLNSRMLGGILLASVIGALVAHGLLGPQPAFSLAAAGVPEWPVYVATPVVAALAALVGVLFQRFALATRAWNKRATWARPWLRVTAGGVAVWAIGSAVFLTTGRHGVFGLGYEDLSAALNHRMDWTLALVLLFAKIAATSVCYGLGACGGIFAPTLFFGGMTGAACAGLLGLVFPLSDAGHVTLAVVGMCACLGAVVRAPVTGLLIVFEMTREFALVPALMVAGLISLAISRRFSRQNFYDAILDQDGQQVERVAPPRDLRAWQETPVSRIANFRPVIVTDLSPGALREVLAAHRHERFPVVLSGQLAGAVTREEAEAAIAGGRPAKVEPVPSCRRDHTIRSVQSSLLESPANLVVVVGGEDGQVIGLVTLHDLLRAELLLSKEH